MEPHDTQPLRENSDHSSIELPREPPPTHTFPERNGDIEKAGPCAEQSDQRHETGHPVVPKSELWTIVILLTISTFLVSLNASTLATAIPVITQYFQTISDVGWYGSAYLLANCSLLPLTGKLYTYFSTRYTYIAFLVIFEIGSLVSATAKTSEAFIVGRAISGAGQAGIINGAIAMITTVAPLDQRPLLIGWILSMSSIGAVVGPLIGGAITQHISWRWCFYINLPPGGAVVLPLLFLKIPDRVDRTNRSIRKVILHELDLFGFILFAPAVVMLLLATEWGGIDYAWNSSVIIGLFVGSGATFIAFLLWAWYKGEAALIPPRFFHNTVIVCSCVTGFFQMGGLLLLTYYLPIWFQVIKDASPTMSGVMNLPTMISMIIATVLAGWMVGKWGYHTPWAILGSALTAIGAGLMSTFSPSSSAGDWIGYQVLAGAGRGSVLPQCVVAVQAVLPESEADVGSGFVTFSLFLGGAIFVALGQTIFTNRLGPALLKYAPQVPKDVIVRMGATGVRQHFQGELLRRVILAYNQALVESYYMAAGGAAFATITAFGMGWKSLKKVANGNSASKV